ncbi:MAG: hypothetical protein IJ172_00490 [Ruminococcus sp.]|nr:hypothetical protein [Ruminococcus sp.]MBQ8119243.1 hypothetical protein [Ruminococcus sp.]
MNDNDKDIISEQTILSICKSAAYGETADKTALMHGVTAEQVQQIWAEMPEKIAEYKQFLAEMGAM